jgi:hypothetical protein
MPTRFCKVNEKLYRGGKPYPIFHDLYTLKNTYNITKIISLDDRAGKEIDPFCKVLNIKHIILGLGDGLDPKISFLKKNIIPTLLDDGPTYIHCFHGKDRTGMAVAMFRLFSGWSLIKALTEAYRFGMGSGLSKKTRQTYYNAVKQYSKELDNNNLDSVSLTRQTNSFGNNPSGNSNLSIQNVPSFNSPISDREDNLTRMAYQKIYCKCKSSDLLKPNNWWWSSKEKASQYPTDNNGKLFSASIISYAKIENINKSPNKDLINKLFRNDIDIGIFKYNQYFIISPNVLINIQEEEFEDINNILDIGLRDNSTNYGFAFPGSSSGIGGMPPGSAGYGSLPFGGIG